MKILLIQPPIEDFYRTSIRTQPIGLAYLASSLQSRGDEVEILDCQTDRKKSISTPSALSYLKDFYPFDDRSPFKLYTGFYHFGLDWEEIQRKILESNADVFGISSSFTPYHGEALKVAQLIKEWDSNKVVVMGGSHVSCDPDGVLKNPFVDYIISGEGEYRLSFFVDCLRRGKRDEVGVIDGIGFKRNGEIHINPLRGFIPDLDSLPPPARDLLDLGRYRINRKKSTMIITSRGCPHRCAYCSAPLVMGSSFRARSPEHILQEMMDCHQTFGIEVFDIEDDNFTFDLKRAKRLMALIIEAFGQGRLELFAMNGLSFASLDGELIQLMKKAGFHTLNLSFVSSDPSMKKRIKRPQPITDFDHVLKATEEVGLNVVAYAILGIPSQTVEEMTDTLIYLMGKRVLIGPSIYYPTPGTSLFVMCQKGGMLPPHSTQWRSSALPIETGAFKRLDLITLLRLVRVINFIKGKMDQGEIEEGLSFNQLCETLKGRPEKTLWGDLLQKILGERTFYGLRRIGDQHVSYFIEGTSKKVFDSFLEKGKFTPIMGSRCSL